MKSVMRGKSVWAVAAGALVIIVVTTIVDVILHVVGFYPAMDQPINDVQSAVGTFYRIVIGIAGAWLTARLAPDRPMRHALILGYIGTVLGLVGLIVTWNKALGPRWYSVAHVVLAIPEVWVGAKLYELRSSTSSPSAH
jgi:hypothetical protein